MFFYYFINARIAVCNNEIPARYSNLLFGSMLSSIMVTIISGTVVFVNEGFGPNFLVHWLKWFATAWPIAFPAVLVVAPLVRKVVTKLTTSPE